MTATPSTIDPPTLERLLARLPGREVAVLGDVMLDRYLWGAVTRISPEAPVPVVEVERESVRLGGAANVAANIRALGAVPHLAGVVGDDAAATEVRNALAAAGIDDRGLLTDAERPTTCKTRVVAHSQQVVRVDQEHRAALGAALGGRLRAGLEPLLERLGALVISDYGKGVINRPLLVEVLAQAAAAGVPVCVDPKRSHFDTYRPISVMTPNLLEAGQAMGRPILSDDDLEAVGFGLLARLGAPAVLVTRGERGMSLFEPEQQHTHFPAVAREVFDVTGAGDTVVSTYAVCLAAGAEHKLAAAVANHAAGLVIREIGTAATTVAEIRRSFVEAGILPPTVGEAPAAGRPAAGGREPAPAAAAPAGAAPRKQRRARR